jgi:hypothetical protein
VLIVNVFGTYYPVVIFGTSCVGAKERERDFERFRDFICLDPFVNPRRLIVWSKLIRLLGWKLYEYSRVDDDR